MNIRPLAALYYIVWKHCSRLLVCLLLSAPATADPAYHLKLGANNDFEYLSELLTTVLSKAGYDITITAIDDVPTTRLERMLQDGHISAMMLGKTPQRSRRFLSVDVNMTDNLMNHRILFIPRGQQSAYDPVQSLADLRQLGKVAGMGSAWRDYLIWRNNDLPVEGIGGNWRSLYRMLASGDRGVDYLPRGAHEMAEEWREHPELDVEQNLVLVYPKDHVLYVSPRKGELHRALRKLLPEAEESGLISRLVRKHFPEVFQPPVNLQERRVIRLEEAE